MSPTSCPESSTCACCTWPAPASISADSRKLVETSLITDSGGELVASVEPLTRTLHLAGSHEGGDTS